MMRLLARYRVGAEPLRSERRVELAFVLAVLLLLLTLAYQGLRLALADEVTPVAPAPDSVRVTTLARPAVPVPKARDELRARPLFWPERAPREAEEPPPPVATVEKEKPAPKMKNVVVSGIYGSGQAGGVILSVKQKQQRVAVGEEVAGWRLSEVSAGKALFVSGGAKDQRELVPRIVEAPAGAAAAPAADPAPDTDSDAQGEDEAPTLTLGGRG